MNRFLEYRRRAAEHIAAVALASEATEAILAERDFGPQGQHDRAMQKIQNKLRKPKLDAQALAIKELPPKTAPPAGIETNLVAGWMELQDPTAQDFEESQDNDDW